MMGDQESGAALAEPRDKASLLRRIDEARARFEAALAAVGNPQAPLRPDSWTAAKDLAGHVAVWERRLARDIEATLQGETPERPEPGYSWERMDELNLRDMEAARSQPLAEVMAESHTAFVETRALIASLSEEQLFIPGAFPWTEADPLALWVRYDMWEHYEEHTADLEARG